MLHNLYFFYRKDLWYTLTAGAKTGILRRKGTYIDDEETPDEN